MVDLVPTASLRNDLQLLTTLDGGAVKAFSDISMQIFRQGMQKTKGFSGAANWQRVLDLLSCFGRGRTLRTLAEKLGVTTDTIKAMCRALCHVMLEAARSEPSEAALGEYLHELGFTGAAREVLVAFHVQNGAEVRERGLALDLQVPHFKDLQWRLDVQVASRSLQNEASPSFLLSVATETKEGTVEEHLMHADYATVLRLKHQVEQALKEATSLDTRRLMRHVKLAK